MAARLHASTTLFRFRCSLSEAPTHLLKSQGYGGNEAASKEVSSIKRAEGTHLRNLSAPISIAPLEAGDGLHALLGSSAKHK